MTKILIIGAGRSATSLIDYLIKGATEFNWLITVADVDIKLAEEKVAHKKNATALSFDIRNSEQRRQLIEGHDLIISMLPAFMHGDVARDCVELGKHMATASYVSAEMKKLDAVAKSKNILLLNECGLDPGLDHASAMKIIDAIRDKGGEVLVFKSFCGGLVAPLSNDNPWGYKFSWNPRNVVLAGQGTAQWLDEGAIKFIPYNRLFMQTDVVENTMYGKFDAYANRDSISYIDVYGLKSINTMLRGTLRQHGFCKAWNVFVKLGLTDDSSLITGANSLNYSELIASFLPPSKASLKDRLKSFMGPDWDQEIENKLDFLELFSNKPIKVAEGSPAKLLQALLEEKWLLKPGDKDMIVMEHQFEYRLPGDTKNRKLNSFLAVEGKDEHHTAMALTVGLPLAITVKNFLVGKFQLSGIQLPIIPQVYEPLLDELDKQGISFVENEK